MRGEYRYVMRGSSEDGSGVVSSNDSRPLCRPISFNQSTGFATMTCESRQRRLARRHKRSS